MSLWFFPKYSNVRSEKPGVGSYSMMISLIIVNVRLQQALARSMMQFPNILHLRLTNKTWQTFKFYSFYCQAIGMDSSNLVHSYPSCDTA